MNKQSKIEILKGVSEGRINATQLKRQLAALGGDPNIIPFQVPTDQQTEIPIKASQEFIFLDYDYPGVKGPGGCEFDIAVCKRYDERFRRLDADSKYIVSIPTPGIEPLDLPKYFGPMEIKAVTDESFFEY